MRKPKVDLSRCVCGDKLLLDNGDIVEYVGVVPGWDGLLHYTTFKPHSMCARWSNGRHLPMERMDIDVVQVLR